MSFFSIIIPTLNAATTLAHTLESILQQTFAHYEIVLHDGGSQDETLAIATRFADAFQGRLRIIQKSDSGVYDAMNQALRQARGRWLYFLGADDTLHDADVLRQVAKAIRCDPWCQLLYGDVILHSTQTRYAGEFDREKLLEINICHQAIFYRREVFAEIGDYNLAYPIWADWDFNFRCFHSGQLIIRYLDLVVARFSDLTGLSSTGRDRILMKEIRLLAAVPISPRRARRLLSILSRRWENFRDSRLR